MRSSCGFVTPSYNAAYQNVARDNVGCGLLESFGDPWFDRAFVEESQIQGAFFSMTVPVFPFDECPGVKNASSNPAGYILFGRNLVMDVIRSTNSEIGIAGALAHEYAHQLQFANGWMRPWESTVRTTELEADAFSGLYIGLVKGSDSNMLRRYFQALANGGDYAFNNPGFHGTPMDRVAAGLLGLQVADEEITTGRTFTWSELHSIFVSEVPNASRMSSPSEASAVARPFAISTRTQRNLDIIAAGGTPEIPRRDPRSIPRSLYPRP